jgi:hypothetical protein
VKKHGGITAPAMRWTACIGVGLLIITIGCGKKNPADSGSDAFDYYPMSVGSWWEYSGVFPNTHKDSVAGTVAFPGSATSFRVIRRLLGDTSTTYVLKTPNEIRRYYFLGDTLFYSVYLKFPLAIGNAWAVTAFDSIQYYDSMRVTGKGTVTVPAGTFRDCYRILHKYFNGREDPSVSELWFAPNAGLVYSPGETDSIRLINYKIK